MKAIKKLIDPSSTSTNSYGSLNSFDYSEQPMRQPIGASNIQTYRSITNDLSILAITLNALFGVSLFAMPWSFTRSGLIGGLLVLIIIATMSYEAARILLISQRLYFEKTGEVIGYPEMARIAMGEGWYQIVQAATIISCLGGCTGYMIFFGQTLGQVFKISSTKVLLITSVPLVLLSFIRSFKSLGYFSVLGVLTLFASVLLILYQGSTLASQDDLSGIPLFLPKTILQFVGTTTFSFTIHYCILSIGQETLQNISNLEQVRSGSREGLNLLVDENEREIDENDINRINSDQLTNPIALAFAVCSVVILIVGGGSSILYRNVELVKSPDGNIMNGCEDHVCQNIILNLAPGFYRNVVGTCMSIVLILSYIIILAPAREHIESIILRRIPPPNDYMETIIRNLIRTSLIYFNLLVAVHAPYFGSVVGTIGGLTDALQCYIIPPFIYMFFFKKEVTDVKKRFYYFIALWGVFVIFYTICYSLYQIIKEET